nr:hypothetical protein Itr_chr12CG31160 [Ipomoea trifida]
MFEMLRASISFGFKTSASMPCPSLPPDSSPQENISPCFVTSAAWRPPQAIFCTSNTTADSKALGNKESSVTSKELPTRWGPPPITPSPVCHSKEHSLLSSINHLPSDTNKESTMFKRRFTSTRKTADSSHSATGSETESVISGEYTKEATDRARNLWSELHFTEWQTNGPADIYAQIHKHIYSYAYYRERYEGESEATRDQQNLSVIMEIYSKSRENECFDLNIKLQETQGREAAEVTTLHSQGQGRETD